MDSSRTSSASFSASESEMESSFETGDTTKQDAYFAKKSRFIMSDEKIIQNNCFYPGLVPKQPLHLTSSGSQYFTENNYMNRAFSYYNQQQQQSIVPKQFILHQPNFQPFPYPYRQNVEFSAFAAQQRHPEYFGARYLVQQQQTNSSIRKPEGGSSMRVLEMHSAQKLGPLPGYAQNNQSQPRGIISNDNRRLFVVDSYGRYNNNVNYPQGPAKIPLQPIRQPFYNNQAFEGSQNNINFANSESQPKLLPPQGSKLERTETKETLDNDSISKSTNQEFMGPVSSTWNLSGSYGNSFNSQKYYRDQENDEDNPFYPGEFGKEKHNYLTLDGRQGKKGFSKGKKLTCGALFTGIGILFMAIITLVVLLTVYPKVFERFGLASSDSLNSTEIDTNSSKLQEEIDNKGRNFPTTVASIINDNKTTTAGDNNLKIGLTTTSTTTTIEQIASSTIESLTSTLTTTTVESTTTTEEPTITTTVESTSTETTTTTAEPTINIGELTTTTAELTTITTTTEPTTTTTETTITTAEPTTTTTETTITSTEPTTTTTEKPITTAESTTTSTESTTTTAEPTTTTTETTITSTEPTTTTTEITITTAEPTTTTTETTITTAEPTTTTTEKPITTAEPTTTSTESTTKSTESTTTTAEPTTTTTETTITSTESTTTSTESTTTTAEPTTTTTETTITSTESTTTSTESTTTTADPTSTTTITEPTSTTTITEPTSTSTISEPTSTSAEPSSTSTKLTSTESTTTKAEPSITIGESTTTKAESTTPTTESTTTPTEPMTSTAVEQPETTTTVEPNTEFTSEVTIVAKTTTFDISQIKF